MTENDADDRIDIGNGDLAVMVHIGSTIDNTLQEDLDDGVDISHAHLTIKVHVTKGIYWLNVVTSVVAIERLQVHRVLTQLSILAEVELDGLERDGIGAHIVSATQRLQVNQQDVVLARGKCRGIVLGLELEVVGHCFEAVARINLHILHQHGRIEYQGNRIGQAEQFQIISELQIRSTVRGILTCNLAGFLIESSQDKFW